MTRSPDKTHAAAERPAPADPHGLPDPRHVERLPAGLPPKAVSRIRHALHQAGIEEDMSLLGGSVPFPHV